MGRRKLFFYYIIILITPLLLFGTIHIFRGMYKYAIVNYLLVLTFFSLLFILSFMKDGKQIYRLVTVLLELLLFYWVLTGAVNGYASIWAVSLPIFSFFFMGKKEGFFWSLICLIFCVVIFINPRSIFPYFSYPVDYASRHLFTYVIVFAITYSYESVREKYKAAMEGEHSELILEKEKLTESKNETEMANRLLNYEIEVRKNTETELRRHRDHLEEIVAERTLEIKQNNEKLEASERHFRLIADNIDDLIWSTDPDLNFTFISPSIKKMFGYTPEEAMVLPHDRWNTPESYSRMIKTYMDIMELHNADKLDLDKYIILQLDQIKKDGSVFPAELKVSIIRDENNKLAGIVGITRDITKRLALEQEKEKIKNQLVQSQKMEALGTLVGGLAHDFNNFLTGIIGSFNMIKCFLQEEAIKNREEISSYISMGIDSSKRSAGLIKQLLILSKKHDVVLAPLNIKDSLKHIYELCKNSLPKSVELDFQIEDTPLVIMGDTIQIEQVILNLCINASHAMTIMRPPGSKEGGKLTVTALKIESDYVINEAIPESAGELKYWIRIKISDTGVGIEDENLPKIFEPFFSTKTHSESTGLGLAISYNIVKKHGGIIKVYSVPGSGSCFSIYFPVYSDGDIMQDDMENNRLVRGKGTVLIIDDEPVILKIAEGFLKQCGYNVITAEGADEGVKSYKNRHTDISAVLLDLSMPIKSGLEVFHELQKIDKDVKAILTSGMFNNESRELALKMGVRETVNKPYMASELSVKIKSVIED